MVKFCEVCQAHKDDACHEDLFTEINFLDGDEIAASQNSSCDLILEKSDKVLLIEHKIREWFSCFYGDVIDTAKQKKKIRNIKSKINNSLSLVNTEDKKVLCFLAFSKKVCLPIYDEDSLNTQKAKNRVNQAIQMMDASFLKTYIKERLFSQLSSNGIYLISNKGMRVFLSTGECVESKRFLY